MQTQKLYKAKCPHSDCEGTLTLRRNIEGNLTYRCLMYASVSVTSANSEAMEGIFNTPVLLTLLSAESDLGCL